MRRQEITGSARKTLHVIAVAQLLSRYPPLCNHEYNTEAQAGYRAALTFFLKARRVERCLGRQQLHRAVYTPPAPTCTRWAAPKVQHRWYAILHRAAREPQNQTGVTTTHAAESTYAESSVWPKSPRMPRVIPCSGPIFGGVTNDRTELIAKASSPHE